MLGALARRKIVQCFELVNLIQIELLIYYIVPVAQKSNGIHEMI